MADNKKISELQRATPEGIFDFIIASGDDNYKVNYTSVAEHSSIGTKSGIFTKDLTISGKPVSTGSHWLSYNSAGVGVNKTVPTYTLEVGGDLNVWGNIYTGGKLFDVEAEALAIKGNLITINSGEQGQGVSRTIAGLLIDRGTYPSGSFLFNEGYDGFSASHNLIVTGGRHLGIGITTPSHALHMTSGQLVGLTGAFSDQLTISGENVSTGVSPTDISDLSSRLISTGSNLDAYIDSVSESLDLVSGKVDTVSGHVVGIQTTGLAPETGHFSKELTISGVAVSTGKGIDERLDVLSGHLITTGANLSGNIKSLSGDLIATGTHLHDHIIEVSGDLITTGQFLQSQISVNANGIGSIVGNLIATGSHLHDHIIEVSGNVDTVSGSVVGIQTTGLTPETGHFSKSLTISGVSVATGSPGTDPRVDVLSGHLISTGQALLGDIGAVAADLITTGANLSGRINTLSGVVVANFYTLSGNLNQTGAHLHEHIDTAVGDINTLSGNLIQTGSHLHEHLDAVSGSLSVVSGGLDTLSGNVIQTGSHLHEHIDSVSGSLDLVSGDLDTVSSVLNSTNLSSNPVPELVYYSGGKLNTSENLIFSENGLGIKSGTEPSFAPGYTLHVNGNAYISGNLYTGGKLVDVTAEQLTVEGNIITINSGQVGAGVTKTIAGIAIDRGTLPSGLFLFNETYDGFSASHNLVVTGGRHLGIGTTTPSYALHIAEGELHARTGTFTDSLTISGETVSTGVSSSDISDLSTRLISTGASLDSYIDGVSGNLIQTGAHLHDHIDTLSGQVIGSINTLSGDLIQTGSHLHEHIDIVSGNVVGIQTTGLSPQTGHFSKSLTISGNPVSTGLSAEWLTHNLQPKYKTSYIRPADVVLGDYFVPQAPNTSGQLSINKISDSSASIHLAEKNNQLNALTSAGWTGYLYWGTGDGSICSLTVGPGGMTPWNGRWDLQPASYNGRAHYKQYSSDDRNLWWNLNESRWVMTAALGDPTAFYTLGAEPWTSQWFNGAGASSPLTVSSCSYTDIWDNHLQLEEYSSDGGSSVFYGVPTSLAGSDNYYFNARFISGNSYAAPTHSKWVFDSSPTLAQEMSGVGPNILSFESVRGGNLSGVESGIFDTSLTISGISVVTGYKHTYQTSSYFNANSDLGDVSYQRQSALTSQGPSGGICVRRGIGANSYNVVAYISPATALAYSGWTPKFMWGTWNGRTTFDAWESESNAATNVLSMRGYGGNTGPSNARYASRVMTVSSSTLPYWFDFKLVSGTSFKSIPDQPTCLGIVSGGASLGSFSDLIGGVAQADSGRFDDFSATFDDGSLTFKNNSDLTTVPGDINIQAVTGAQIAVKAIHSKAATLLASFNETQTVRLDDLSEAYVCWGETDEGTSDKEDWDDFGYLLWEPNSTVSNPTSQGGSQCFIRTAAGLSRNDTYYARAVITVNGTDYWSSAVSFKTSLSDSTYSDKTFPFYDAAPSQESSSPFCSLKATGNLTYAMNHLGDGYAHYSNYGQQSPFWSSTTGFRLGIKENASSEDVVRAKLDVHGNAFFDDCPAALFNGGNVGVGVDDPSAQLTVSGSAIISGSALFYLDYDQLPKSEPNEKGRIWIDSANDNVLKVAVGAGGVTSTQWFELVGDSLKLRDTAYDSSNPAIEFWEADGNGAYRPAAPGQTTSSAVAYFELNSQGDVQPTLNP